jgi:hypothetical protein
MEDKLKIQEEVVNELLLEVILEMTEELNKIFN